MKKLILILVLIIPITLVAQETLPSMEFFFGKIDAVYIALMTIGGYLSFKIPGLNKIGNGVYRILAFAVILAAIFFFFGFNKDVIGLAFSYFMSTSLYEVVLKQVFKTPKPDVPIVVPK